MKKSLIVLALALTLAAGACAQDVTASDEYQALELEVAALEQQVAETTAELAEAQAGLEERGELAGAMEVPAEVVALLDEWWAANDRKDGSVVDLYRPSGYHLYGDKRISLDNLAAHLGAPGWTHEWITEPYLVAAEPEGRYVVTRGVRNTYAGQSSESALTFEILTSSSAGDLKIAQTSWTNVHG